MSAREHSNYQHGFEGGVTIRGLPILNSYSKEIRWVSSTAPANGKGTFKRPFSSVDAAINESDVGDIILAKEAHAETFTAAAGFDADVAGISIIGLGNGNRRPTFTFTTATTADVDIDAANITLANLRFVCGIDSQVAMVDINAAGAAVVGCEFSESSATGLTCIDVNGGAANACDKTYIARNVFRCATAANWDRAIELGEVADGVVIEDNDIVGDFDDAGIHNITGKVLTNLTIRRNFVRNNQAGQHAIELVSACTGQAYGNRLVTDARATAFDAGALSCSDNLWNSTTGGDTEGQPVNAAGETLQAGEVFVVSKTLTSSAVVQAGVDVTAVSAGGTILIEDVVLATDGTGLAAGTNFTLDTDNAKGDAVFISHAVASLGAQALVDKKTASTGKSIVLESGKKVIAKCTVADCTGAGTINVYLVCRRLAAGATLAAA